MMYLVKVLLIVVAAMIVGAILGVIIIILGEIGIKLIDWLLKKLGL